MNKETKEFLISSLQKHCGAVPSCSEDLFQCDRYLLGATNALHDLCEALDIYEEELEGECMSIDLESVANQILECVDYDIYKEDVMFGEGYLRDEIENILEELRFEIKKEGED